jgi:hypothetical protein
LGSIAASMFLDEEKTINKPIYKSRKFQPSETTHKKYYNINIPFGEFKRLYLQIIYMKSLGRDKEQLAISARHGGGGQLRLRFREKIDQALPRLRGVAVELQQFLIALDVQFDDPWIFHHL